MHLLAADERDLAGADDQGLGLPATPTDRAADHPNDGAAPDLGRRLATRLEGGYRSSRSPVTETPGSADAAGSTGRTPPPTGRSLRAISVPSPPPAKPRDHRFALFLPAAKAAPAARTVAAASILPPLPPPAKPVGATRVAWQPAFRPAEILPAAGLFDPAAPLPAPPKPPPPTALATLAPAANDRDPIATTPVRVMRGPAPGAVADSVALSGQDEGLRAFERAAREALVADPATALALYERLAALVPGQRTAQLGRAAALRQLQALARRHPGDARPHAEIA